MHATAARPKSTKRPSNPFLIGPVFTQSHEEACRTPPGRFRTLIRVPAWTKLTNLKLEILTCDRKTKE